MLSLFDRLLYNRTTRRWPLVLLAASVSIVAPRPDQSIVLASSAALRPAFLAAAAIADGGESLRPQGGSGPAVTGGYASLNRVENGVLVRQTSPRLVIEWPSFEIGPRAAITFVQPDANAIALIVVRHRSPLPTRILGSLKANGRIAILDSQGIVVGGAASIEVAGLIASTGRTHTARFLSGSNSFAVADATNGVIDNAGTVVVTGGGTAAFVAPHIVNSGVIQADSGSVALTTAIDAVVDLDGAGVVAPTPSGDAGTGDVVRLGGVVRARSVGARRGRIVVDGGAIGKVRVSGALDASGAIGVETGGYISVVGKDVSVDGASVSASGASGGGEVYIGGFGRRGNSRTAASSTTVSADSAIHVDALTSGSGGTAVVASRGHTAYAGMITAKGGKRGGNGGLTEISTGRALVFRGVIDTTAAAGRIGRLVIDPVAITIGNVPSVIGNDAYLSAQDIADALVFSSLEVLADNTIDFVDDIDLSYSTFGRPTQDLFLTTGTVNLRHNVRFGDGAVHVNAATVNLDGKVTSGGTLLGNARLFGTATQINVLSNNASIQQAIAMASKKTPFNPAAPAATIDVAGGQRYFENLTIDKSLTLRGDPGDPAVAGAGAAAATLAGTVADGAAITIAAADVTVTGFNVNAQVFGGWLDNSNSGIAGSGANITIRDNTFTGFDINGVALPASQNLDIENNLFTNIGVNAVSVPDSTSAVTEPNTIQGAAAGTFAQVSAGFHHTCTVRSDRTLTCWGDNAFGEAVPPPGIFTSVDAGSGPFSCAVNIDGNLACWGLDTDRESEAPAGAFTQVSAGGFHACGIMIDGTLACWGANSFGQATPPPGRFVQVSAGVFHTCALTADGVVVCWGGDAALAPPAGVFIQISAGDSHSCGIRSDGTIACWGSNFAGESTPPAGTFTQVSAGDVHSCAVSADETLACWGDDRFGQATPPAGSFAEVSAGTIHSCGLTTDSSVVCWGDNSYGQATPSGSSAASQIITISQAPPPTAAFNTAFSVSATASSGLPVAIAALGACSIAGGTVTMTSGSGICMVTFDQGGNASYAAAPQIARTTIAELATPTVSVTGGTFAFDGAPHGAIGFAYGVNGINDLLAPPTFSYVGTGGTVYGPTPTPPTAVGTYNAVGFFAGTGNYAAAANSAAITIYAATPAAAQTLAYVANQFPDTLSVIDTSTRTVIRTIPLHQPPDIAGDVALTPDGRFLYVTDPGGSVLVLDAATYARVAMIPLGTNLDARDIVISPDGAWAYVVQKNTNNVSVIDTASRAVVAVVDVGTLPTRIAFSPDGRFAYVTNSLSNDVSVIETATRTVVGAIPVDSFPNDIAVVTVGGAVRAYVTAWAASAVSVLDLSSNTLVGSIPLEGAWTIEASRDGSFVAVAQWSLATKGLTIIDTATNTVRSTLAVSVEQANIKLTPDDAFAYLTDFSGNLGPGDSVFIVDLTANAIVTEVPVGITPFGMAIGTPAVSAVPPIGGACSIVSASAATFAIGAAGTFSVVTVGCPVGTNIRIVGQPPPGTPVAGLTFTNNGDGTATLSGTPEAGTAGVYSILIAATNGASPDAVQFFTLTIDTPVVVTAPDTTLTLYPPPLSFSRAATFRFESNTPGVFACSLDGSAFTPCTSPQNYLGLANGTHSFAVQATDLFNTTDPTPATYSWTIDVAADYEVLKYFGQRGQDLSDGGLPESTVALGSDGFLYGTTVAGRDAPCSPSVLHGCYNAPVYKIDAAGNFFVLDRFEAFAEPSAQLIRARDGSFYGTDAAGPLGYGSVFKVDATGHLIKLHTFDPFTEGRPIFGVTEAADGYFYGTTIGSPVGQPTLFRFDSAGQLTVLHVFDPTEGTPSGRLIQGPDGELYGTTSGGSGGGTIFRSTTSGDVTVLHVFDPGATVLSGGLLLASDGYFYGQTLQGSIFKIAADGTFSVVHELGAINNSVPGALIQATDGNLYGTTSGGGQFGGGTVFRMDLNGNVTILHSFGSDGDGLFVLPGVVQGSDGALYGTTQAGRGLLGAGTIFRLSLTAGPAASDLLVSPATGSVGGTTTLSAALSSSGAPIAGRVVSFTLNGIAVGAASTDDAGGASLTGVRLAGVFAGSYPNAIQASFGGDASFAAATGSADLLVLDVVTPALPTIVVTSPSEPIYELGSLVTVQYSCIDSETCTSDVANGSALDTTTPGLHSFTITATSFGNVTTERVAYTVSFGTAVPPFAGLTAWLPGDGAATDEVTGTDATWTGTPAYATGKVAQAFAVAAGNAVTLPFTQTGPFTLQAWVRTPNRLQPEFAGIVSSGGPGQAASTFQLELDGFGNYRLNAGSGDLSILIGPATDVFQHLAVTFDGATIVTYLNGQIVESAAWFGSPDLGFTTLAIGVDREAVSPFEGFVDEVQVFNRALSDVEVLQTFEAGASGLQKNRAPIAAAAAAPNPAEAAGLDGATVAFDASASIDPDGDALTYLWQEGPATLGSARTISALLSIGTHIVTLTVDDGHHHTVSVDVRVVVQDTTAPVMSNVAADVVAEATSASGAVVTFSSPTAADLVDGFVPVKCAPASGSVFALGATPVTCTATDAHANGASATFLVTVVDTTGPVLTLPPPIVAEATSPAGAVVTFTATALDAVTGPATVMCLPAAGSTFPTGLTVVTCTATDATGHATTGGFQVLVGDTTAPVAQIVSPSPDALITASATDVIVQVADALGVASVAVNGVAATLFAGTPQAGTWRATVPSGGRSLPIGVTASDAARNSGTASRVVDNDGIPSIAPAALDRGRTNGIDQSALSSNDFNNGVTSGTLVRNGWTARLSNAPTVNGVRVQVTGAGTAPARVLACIGAAKEVRLDVVGETADITCDPATGTITAKAVSAVAKIEVWKQTSPTTWTVAQLPTGAIYSTGSPATADRGNASPITVDVVQIDAAGAPLVVGSFDLAPGASVDVTTAPGASRGSEQLHFHVLRGVVPFRLGARTRTLKPGDLTVLPIENRRQ